MDKDEDFEKEQEESLHELIEKNKNRHIPNPIGQNSQSGVGKELNKSQMPNRNMPKVSSLGISKSDNESDIDIDDGDFSANAYGKDATVSAKDVYISLNNNKSAWIAIILVSALLFGFLFLISVVFLLKNSDNLNYFSGNFFVNEEYQKLYSDVDKVVARYQSKYGVTVDKYLIIATLTAYQDNSMYFDNTESGAYDNIVVDEDSFDEDGNPIIISKSIDQMTAKIEILAKYQIKTVTTCSLDSSTIRKIASNDDSIGLFNFWTSAAAREKNYDCSSNGGTWYTLSTEEGKIDDDTSGSTFYWNLIDEDFFKEYYPEYFSGIRDKDLYDSHAAKVVEYIYLYAKALKELDCNNPLSNGSGNLSTNFSTNTVSCPAVTVLPDSDGNYGGTYQLEEYVAGVIADEFSPNYMNRVGNNSAATSENLKAFAVAIRSYTISRTHGCTNPIRNGSNDQNFRPTDDALIWAAVNETAGLVLTHDGKVISAEYDSFKGNTNCDSDVCSYDYRKIPGNTTHTVTIPASWRRFAAGGHGRGMSQLGALYLAIQGKNYQEIVKYFYDDNVQIERLLGSSNSSSSSAYCQRTGSVLENTNGTCDGTTIYGHKAIGSNTLNRSMSLLTCTANQAEQAFNEIASACGIIPHAGSMRSLGEGANAARSATSLHYLGRAFDFDTTEGMREHDTYFYVTLDDTSGNDNSHYYRVYCKVIGQTNSAHAGQKSIIPVRYSAGRYISKVAVTDNFLDVTAVLNSYGLYGIGPRSCARNGNYMCTEWWHFQDTSGFVRNETTFEQALNQYYGNNHSYAGTVVSGNLGTRWNGGSFS